MRKTFISFIILLSFCAQTYATNNTPDSNSIVSITPQNVHKLLVDNNATRETRALFYNLSQTAKQGVIVGQQDGYSRRLSSKEKSFSADTDIYTSTGYRALTSGEDLQFLTDDRYDKYGQGWYYEQMQACRESVIKSYELGVFTSFSWHFREPYGGRYFYSKELSDEVKGKAFKSLLKGGENHKYYCKKLDLIANFFKSFKDENGTLIPVIFRPFHEMEGSWFWWGIPHYATAQEYKELWQFTVKYLRDKRKVHNVLYAFSPDKNFPTEAEYLTCYPGDAYVDIIGFDTYEDYSVGESARLKTISQLRIIDKLAKEKGKIAALTECGYAYKEKGEIKNLYSQHYYGMLQESGADISYMLFWAGFLPTTATDTSGLVNDLKDYMGKERIITEQSLSKSLFRIETSDKH